MQQAIQAAFSLSISEGLTLLALGDDDDVSDAVSAAAGRGMLAEAIELKDPAERDAHYAACTTGSHVVLIGSVSGPWHAYGPFADDSEADDFADENSSDTDFAVLSLKG